MIQSFGIYIKLFFNWIYFLSKAVLQNALSFLLLVEDHDVYGTDENEDSMDSLVQNDDSMDSLGISSRRYGSTRN